MSGRSPRGVRLDVDGTLVDSDDAHAGVSGVAFRTGGWADAALRGALAIYDDPAHLVADWSQSPFADAGARH